MKLHKNFLHFINFLFFVGLPILCLGCISEPVLPQRISSIDLETNITFPLQGSVNRVSISTEFLPVGIIFVTSTEVVDQLGNQSGSKITYEMFMREAEKIQAHEIININVDLNVKREKQIIQNRSVIVTTYTYTGTGLAIKYANASLEMAINSRDDLPNTMLIPNNFGNVINIMEINNLDSSNNNIANNPISDNTRLTVINMTGTIWRSANRNASTRIKIGDVIIAGTKINMNSTALVIFSDGINEFTITGRQSGKISNLIK